MTLRKKLNSRPELLIALIGVVIAAAWLPLRTRFPFDDTYITFRYAQNVAHGFGIVWNPGGAHTEGYTNFLYMLLLVPFSWMGSDLVNVAQLRNVIVVIITAIAIWKITNHESRVASEGRGPAGTPGLQSAGVLAVALFYLSPFTWMNAYSGMETSLFTMFIVLAIGYLNHSLDKIRRRGGEPSRWSLITPFWIATLATLTRPEGALLGPILLLVILLTQRDKAHRVAAITGFATMFVAPLVMYAAWKWWYFGDLLPNSFYVKVAQSGVFLPGRGTVRIFYTGVWYLVLPALFAIREWKKSAGVKTMIVWCVALSTFYLFSQLIQPQYDRFMYSIEVMLIMLAAIGLARINMRGVAATVAVVVALLVVAARMTLIERGALGYIQDATQEHSCYRRVAKVFSTIPDREHILLCWSDAGILPYYAGMNHLDPVGLNTNEIAHAASGEQVARYIAQARPDILFIPRDLKTHDIITWGHGLIGHAYPLLLQQPELRTYRAIATIPQTVYDLDVLVDTTSVHYRDIVRTIIPRIGKDLDFSTPTHR